MSWAVYVWSCSAEGCRNSRSLADHDRRDPESFEKPRCPTHGDSMEFVGTEALVPEAERGGGDGGLVGFIRESNAIERIHRQPADAEVQAHEALLACGHLTLGRVSQFVLMVAGRDAKLRSMPGMDVRPAGAERLPLAGGPGVVEALRRLITRANADTDSPYAVHVVYEALHPFMDGNGRSGRAIWAWMMLRQGRDPFSLPFLHRWYYDSLEGARTAR